MWRQLLLVVCLSHACAVLACPNGCNRKGTCRRGTSTCDCFHGYGGADCSKKLCPAGPAWSDIAVDDDTAHTEAVCSNRGSCNELTGRCQCDEGFQGLACQRRESFSSLATISKTHYCYHRGVPWTLLGTWAVFVTPAVYKT